MYTVREYTKDADSFRDTMRKLAAIGFKYAQVSGVGPTVTPEVIAEASKETGIKVVLTHTSPKRMMEETETVIREHELFGCNYLGIGGIPTPHTKDGVSQFIEQYGPTIEKLKKAGKTLLYHNHRFEFERYEGFGGKTALEVILENTDPDGLKLTFDTYWAAAAGVDPADFIDRHADRIAVTHLKDMAVINNEPVMTEVLTGNLNFDRILEVCDKHEIMWHMIEQDVVRINAIESLRISHDNLKAKYPLI